EVGDSARSEAAGDEPAELVVAGRVERRHRRLQKLVLELRSRGERGPIEGGSADVFEPGQRKEPIKWVAVDGVDVAHGPVDLTHLRRERRRGRVVERCRFGHVRHRRKRSHPQTVLPGSDSTGRYASLPCRRTVRDPMSSFPLEQWEANAAEVERRFYGSGHSPMAKNGMAELDPQLADLVQVIARGRSYADPTVDLKTRALCTMAC